MTMRHAPIASGARVPAPGAITVLPMVKTRKGVPMNSTTYFFMPTARSSLRQGNLDLWEDNAFLPGAVGGAGETAWFRLP
jgi:hypothetical protein